MNDKFISYNQLAKALNEYPTKTEYKQAGLALLKKIFQHYTKPEWIDIAPEQPNKNEIVKVRYADGTETIAKYTGTGFIVNDSKGWREMNLIQWKRIKQNKELPQNTEQ